MRVAGNPTPSVGSPARAKVLARHAKNLASGNPRLHAAAIKHLTRMNMTPVEQMYVQSKTKEHVAKKAPKIPSGLYANVTPQAVQPQGKNLKPLKTGPTPVLGSAKAYHQGRLGRSQRQLRKTMQGYQREQQQLGQMVNPVSHENLVNMAENLTGYHEIKNIRNHPIAGGLAIAGLLPFGRVGHIVEEARAAEAGTQAARAAERGSRISEFKAGRQALKAARRGSKRTAEQATQHVLSEAKKARQQGFGRILPKVSTLKPGEVTPATGGEAGRLVRQGLHPDFKGMGAFEKVGAKLDNPGIATLRKKQEELRAIERSSRAGAIEKASAGKSGLARHAAAKAALEGKLPAKVFHGFEGLKAEGATRSLLPTEEHLVANPRERFIPITYRDGHITVGEAGGSHVDLPKGDGVQGYALVENGKIVRTNFTAPQGAPLPELGKFIDKYDRNPEVQNAVRTAVESKFSHTTDLRDSAINHIYDHPHFQPYEKVRAADALDEAIAGKVPTKGDQKLLERAFGKEQVSGVIANLRHGGTESAIANVMNIPRSIMASGDLSAPFRQGLVVMASHPRIFFSGFAPMLRAARSEEYFQRAVQAIHDMPEFPLMEKAGVSLTDIGDTAKGAANINKREEQFASNLAEQIPGIGHMVRGSDRAYVLFLNAARAKVFAQLTHQAAESGYHLSGPQGEKLLKDIGKFVNSATGRGDLGKLGEHTATLNALFFSPRLMASRFNFLNPLYYARMEPFARRQSLKAALRLAGTLNLVLFIAKMGGAKVVTDPRNADFGKIRIGNTRVDFAGGFTQPIRLLDQLYTGQVVSSTSGKVENLSSSGFGRSRLDVAMQFLENKAAPVPSAVIDALKGGSFGQKFSPKNELEQRFIPLLWQDLAQIYHSTGPKGVAGYGLPDLFGVGVQNYGAPAKKKNAPSPYGGSNWNSGWGSSGWSGSGWGG